ncbi:MAG TPA: hypothetical protein VLW52_07310 [Opitutaceae bacterium]|nr:hypothetical protein [Opitutaceae bacterium]
MNVLPDARQFRAVPLAALVAVSLAALLYRQGPLLTFDGYHYCEFAKQYATSWPQSFGNHWPCGYPLLGGLLGRLGFSAFAALCSLSLLALTSLIVLGNRYARNLPGGALVLCGLAATPVIGVQLFGNLTELPFAAALLGLAAALNACDRWVAWWIAAACALLALSIRYAGVLAYAALWTWLALEARRLHERGILRSAVIAVSCATAVAAGLLLWNLRATGYLSGAPRGAAEKLGLAAWPVHTAQLGWSPLSALMLGGLRDRAGADSLLGLTTGGLLSLTGAVLCLWAWARPRLPWIPAMACVAFFYGAGMTVLRSTGTFDSLYNGRVFLPALFPLGLVAGAQFSGRWPRLVAGACVLLLAAGAASAARGLSREIGGDVHGALPLLRDRMRADDRLQINDQAFAVAAYFPQRTFRTWPETWRAAAAERFLVVAAEPVDRRGTPGVVPRAWRDLAVRLVAQGTHRWLLDTPGLLVVEHDATPP